MTEIQDQVMNAVACASEDSWFCCRLNGADLLLPRDSVLMMAGCLHLGAPGPLTIFAETAHLNWMIERLPGAAIFFDIGSSIGQINLPIAKAYPDLPIIAFEPARRARGILSGTIARNGVRSIEVIPAALSDIAGTAAFSEYRADVPGQPANLPEGSAIHSGRINPDLLAAQYPVEVTTLDQFCADRGFMKTRAVIKIDVEGFEEKVVRGGGRYIDAARPWLAIDIHCDPFEQDKSTEPAVRDILGSRGYEFENLDHVLLCSPR